VGRPARPVGPFTRDDVGMMPRMTATVVTATVMVTVLAAACGTAPGDDGAGDTTGSPTEVTAVRVGDRPVSVHVPAASTGGSALPLVIALHGYTSNGAEMESYMRIAAEADRRGFLYAFPDGSRDSHGDRFWNATDACCDLYGSGIDDSRYLTDVIDAIQRAYPVDPRRVYLIGHSNGAFMAFRAACDHADRITAIAAFNGAMWQDTSRCRPSQPVSVLAIHSTADEYIAHGGGSIDNRAYPSADRTAADWVGFDRCTDGAVDAAALDVVADLPGAETAVRDATGCAGGSAVRTWTIDGGRHVPRLAPTFTPAVLDFLLATTRP
jgi:polyhydroxybutyrate depolymerase